MADQRRTPDAEKWNLNNEVLLGWSNGIVIYVQTDSPYPQF